MFIEERPHCACNTAHFVRCVLQKFGIDQGTAMCKRILESGDVHGLHMYTLNMERSAIAILENLGLINEQVSWQPHHGLRRSPLHMRCIPMRSCLWHRCRAHCLGGRPLMYTAKKRVCGQFTGALLCAKILKARKQLKAT
jgi:Methylenetetrahydrofolate reductase